MYKRQIVAILVLMMGLLGLSACSEKSSESKSEHESTQMEPVEQVVEEKVVVAEPGAEVAPEESVQVEVVAEEVTGEPTTDATMPAVEGEKTEAEAAPAAESKVDLPALLKSNGCLTCHSIDKKMVGPSYKEVAAKYKDQADAKQKLIDSITNGSSGKWGSMAMPANAPRVTAEDIEAIASGIMSLN